MEKTWKIHSQNMNASSVSTASLKAYEKQKNMGRMRNAI